jgi:hypothetical protein
MHLTEGARSNHPLVQREAADAEWILESLMRASAVAIDRDSEAMNAESCHQQIPLRTVGLFQRGNIELHHLQQRIGDPLRPSRVALVHHLVQQGGHDLPSQAEPVDQPPARLRLAAAVEDAFQ